MKLMGKIFTFILIVALLFVIAVLIAGSINGLSFTEQIYEWFGMLEDLPEDLPEIPEVTQ